MGGATFSSATTISLEISMPRLIAFALLTAGASLAAVPSVFSSGQPARSEEVNKNFAYLDSTVGTKATQASLGTVQLAVTGLQASKAEQTALEDAIKLIASKVGTADLEKALKGKVDTSVVRALAELVAKKAEAEQIGSLKDAVGAKADTTTVRTLGETLDKKADAAWVSAQIAASAPSGMLSSGKNLSDLSDKAAARTNLGLGALAEKSSLSAADVGALTSSAADATYLQAREGYIASYKQYTDGTNPKVPKLAIGDSQYGFASAGGVLELYSATGSVRMYQTAGASEAQLLGYVATKEWTSGSFAALNAAKPYGEWNFAGGDPTKYVDPEPKVGRDAKFGGTGIATNGLHVNGNATVTGTINGKVVTNGISSSNVADYVFEPGYQLAPLSEVEAYTKAHKHLPEVPSAAEIETNGLDLAQMNLVLLKKVEELTLHTIELEKRVKVLEGSEE